MGAFMTYDRRYPHMIPLDGRAVTGLSDSEKNAAVRIGKSVASRTQTHPFYNLYTGGIFFSRYTAPTMAPYEMPFKPNGMVRRIEDHQIDQIVSYMNLSLIPDSVKEKWEKQRESTEQHDRREAQRADIEGRAHEFEDYATFRDRKRRGTQTVVKVL